MIFSNRPFLVSCLALVAAAASVHSGLAAGPVPLSSLDLTNAVQGWGNPSANLSVEQHTLTIAGHKYATGFGTHAVGMLSLNLAGGSTRFHSVVGVDDETNGKGSVVFSVIADGKEIWNSGTMRGGDLGKVVDLDLTGVKKLLLKVGDAGDGFDFDHADWADASLEVTGAAPETVKLAQTDPVISTEPSPDAPRIHPPHVFGALSGKPFSFTVSASGEIPIRYTVTNLPPGVLFNDGVVTGTVQSPGNYVLSVRAANSAGTDKANISLKVGDTLALTPPMGWNSYDGFGDSVTEAETLANARAIQKYLKPHGWQYVVVDYRWYDPGAHDNNANARAGAALTMDQYGRLLPALNRFPSAVDESGFKALADKVHAMGLRFGIHIMRGIPRNAVDANLPIEGSTFTAKDAYHTDGACVWCQDMYPVNGDSPAGQAWYDSIFRQYASWGLDFVKVDDLSRPYHTDEINAIRRAIDKCGRAIVFSTSPGPTPVADAASIESVANQWRMTDDMWDNWGQLVDNMNYGSQWYGHGEPGHWPDTDMLPFGLLSVGGRSVGSERQTKLTKSEQVALLTYDVLMPAPLMLGGDFSQATPWEISLLTNDEVLAVNQDVQGSQGHRVYNNDGVQVWTKPLQDGSIAVGLFNQTLEDDTPTISIADLGLKGKFHVRDLWQRKELGDASGTLAYFIPAHGAVLLTLSQRP